MFTIRIFIIKAAAAQIPKTKEIGNLDRDQIKYSRFNLA